MRNIVLAVERLREVTVLTAFVGGILGFLLGFGSILGAFARNLPAVDILIAAWLSGPPRLFLRALGWTLAVSTFAGIMGGALGSILASNLVRRPRRQLALWDLCAASVFVTVVLIAITYEKGICREFQEWWDSQAMRIVDNPPFFGLSSGVADNDPFTAISPDGKTVASGGTWWAAAP